MSRTNAYYVALFVLLVTVPLVVGAAGLASFLLLRAGYGLVVGGLAPLLAMLLLVGCLGVILLRTVGSTPSEGPRRGSSRKDSNDDV